MDMAATTAWKVCTVSLTLDSLKPGSVARLPVLASMLSVTSATVRKCANVQLANATQIV